MFGRTRPCPCFIGRHHFLTKIEDLQGWLRHFQFSRLFFTCFTSNCWTIYARNVSQQNLCLLVPMAGNQVSPLRRSQSVLTGRRDLPAHSLVCVLLRSHRLWL